MSPVLETEREREGEREREREREREQFLDPSGCRAQIFKGGKCLHSHRAKVINI